MANIPATEVKRLRDATGAGMMAAKRALEEADGDQDKAAELLRIKGETKVKERGAERTASNGLVAAAEGAMIQLSCETDFVAKNEQFQQLAADIVSHAHKTDTSDVTALLGEKLADGRTVQENIDSVCHHRGEARAHRHRRARRPGGVLHASAQLRLAAAGRRTRGVRRRQHRRGAWRGHADRGDEATVRVA